MSDFVGDRECVTHHHACDCRELMFRKLADESATLRTALAQAREALDLCRTQLSRAWDFRGYGRVGPLSEPATDLAVRIASSALTAADAALGTRGEGNGG